MPLLDDLVRDELACRRICVIKPSALGDVVQALPVLGAIRRRFPASHISWVINAGLASLLEGHARIDALIPFERHGGPGGWWRLARALRAGRFDLTLDLQGLLRTGLMTATTGANHCIGMMTAREGSDRFCNATVPGTGREVPAWERYRRLAEAIEPHGPPGLAELPITDEDRHFVNELLGRSPRPWLAVCPGARWETKRWPAAKFAQVAVRAHQELGASVILLGSPAERSLCQGLSESLEKSIANASLVNLGGGTSLRRLATILQACDWTLANDSGPLHLADAVGTPAVGIFTCTSPTRSGPPPGAHQLVATNLPCAASYHKRCPLAGADYMACHDELDADRVWAGLARLASGSQRIAG